MGPRELLISTQHFQLEWGSKAGHRHYLSTCLLHCLWTGQGTAVSTHSITGYFWWRWRNSSAEQGRTEGLVSGAPLCTWWIPEWNSMLSLRFCNAKGLFGHVMCRNMNFSSQGQSGKLKHCNQPAFSGSSVHVWFYLCTRLQKPWVYVLTKVWSYI